MGTHRPFFTGWTGWGFFGLKMNGVERYHTYLASDHWSELRIKKFQRVGFSCEACGSKKKLQAHHINYRDLYDCTTDDLLALCDFCHASLHAILKSKSKTSKDFSAGQSVALILSGLPRADKEKPVRKLTKHERRKLRTLAKLGSPPLFPLSVNGKYAGPVVFNTVRVTDEFFKAGISETGGWNREQLSAIGIRWPLKHKWKQRALGSTITREQADNFMRLKTAPKPSLSINPF